MGWDGGSSLMDDIMDGMKKEIPDEETRVKVYKHIIKSMEMCDWDTQDECVGRDPAFDKALKELHPEWDI
jgi:hypothetical protein